jgi:toxin-antitoxin system PIN domain toxin
MIGIDTNVLLYAVRGYEDNHLVAKETLEALLAQKESVAFTDIVMFEFIAQATNNSDPSKALTTANAIAQMENWLASPRAQIIRSKPGDFKTFARLCAESGKTGQHIFDAQVAAICIDNGVTEFVTADKGFEKFTELRIRNPFAA